MSTRWIGSRYRSCWSGCSTCPASRCARTDGSFRLGEHLLRKRQFHAAGARGNTEARCCLELDTPGMEVCTCSVCGGAIGVYERVLVIEEELAQASSLAREPDVGDH